MHINSSSALQQEIPQGVLNPAALEQIRALSPDILVRVLKVWLDDADKRVNDLQIALTQQDFAALQRTAHAFKSSNANIGADALYAICVQLETACRQAPPVISLEQAMQWVNNIQQLTQEAKQAVRVLLASK